MMREERFRRLLTALCTVCYFVSYLTRINYGAVLLEIVQTEGIGKVAASMAVTGSFLTYGAGQLVSGWLGDRVNPGRLIFTGLMTSACMNVLVPVFANPGAILVFWCINGFAQALLWPPMVKILSDYLQEDEYKKSCVRVTWGSAVGTIVIYLLAPACIVWKGWRSLFFLCAGIAFCFAFIWIRGIAVVEKRLGAVQEPSAPPRRSREKRGKMSLQTGKDAAAGTACGGNSFLARTAGMLAVIMAAIVMQGLLRDGITTWMPVYLSETFHLASFVSILSGVLLPVFGMVCLELTSVLNRRWFRNEMVCAGVIFLLGFGSAFGLAAVPCRSAAGAVLLAALAVGCMHGVNVILVSMVPPYFKRSNRVGTVSGLLNSCTYVGSAVSSYGIARMAEGRGWGSVLWLWAAAALAGTMLCFGCRNVWNHFKEGHKNCY